MDTRMLLHAVHKVRLESHQDSFPQYQACDVPIMAMDTVQSGAEVTTTSTRVDGIRCNELFS
jgi:hypothetical protein